MNSVQRYKKREFILSNKRKNISINTSEQDLVNSLLSSRVDSKLIQVTTNIMQEHYKLEYDFSVSQDEAKEFLEKFKKDFNQERFDKLIIECKKDVINSIVTPFGLGHIVAAYDKVGGNVDTVHNVRNKDFVDSDGTEYKNGVYATSEAKNTYENRPNYDSNDYHTHKNYKETNKQAKEDKVNGKLIDAFGNKNFKENETTNLDHTVSAKEVSEDPGRILANVDGVILANESSNLNITTPEFNNFKKAKTMNQAISDLDKELQMLNNKSVLTENDKVRLAKLKKIDTELDRDKALEADKKARKEIDSEINKKYYTSGKFAKNTVKTGVKDGAKMGMQQAVGLVMTEFFAALFDEILDIYKNGFSNGFEDDRFFSVLKERLKTIAERLKAKWKDVAIAFKDGFISGFISNLVTTVINMFVTTGKRVVRIIREGMFSLFRAVKLLIFPPENMSYEEALHEAKKLIATGLIVSLGVLIEEAVSQFLNSTTVLVPFSDTLSAIFIGAITGIAITMTAYYIDKKKNDKDTMQEMIRQTDMKFDNVEQMLKQLAY